MKALLLNSFNHHMMVILWNPHKAVISLVINIGCVIQSSVVHVKLQEDAGLRFCFVLFHCWSEIAVLLWHPVSSLARFCDWCNITEVLWNNQDLLVSCFVGNRHFQPALLYKFNNNTETLTRSALNSFLLNHFNGLLSVSNNELICQKYTFFLGRWSFLCFSLGFSDLSVKGATIICFSYEIQCYCNASHRESERCWGSFVLLAVADQI